MDKLKSERLIAPNWWNDDPDEARHSKELNSGLEWYIDEPDRIEGDLSGRGVKQPSTYDVTRPISLKSTTSLYFSNHSFFQLKFSSIET